MKGYYYLAGTLVLGLLTYIGIKLFIKMINKGHKLAKYEFENRTSGGVVEFDTYEDSRNHEAKKVGVSLSGIFGIGLAMFSFLGLFFVVFFWFKTPNLGFKGNFFSVESDQDRQFRLEQEKIFRELDSTMNIANQKRDSTMKAIYAKDSIK